MEQELLQNIDLTDVHPLDIDLIHGIVDRLELLIQNQDEIITLIKQEPGDVKGRLESVRGFLETTMSVLHNGNKAIKKLVDKTILPELPFRAIAAGGKKNKTRKRKHKKHLHKTF